MIVLYNPVTYFVIAGAIAAAGDIPTGGAAFYRRLIVMTTMVLLMPPLAWMIDTVRRSSGSGLSELAKSS